MDQPINYYASYQTDRPNDPNLLQDSEKPFMDDYIHLKNVNFSILAESYIASAKPYS
jgi:hypothetical protein